MIDYDNPTITTLPSLASLGMQITIKSCAGGICLEDIRHPKYISIDGLSDENGFPIEGRWVVLDSSLKHITYMMDYLND